MSRLRRILSAVISADYEARWALASIPLGPLATWGISGSLRMPEMLLGLSLGWVTLRLTARIAFRLGYVLLRLGHRPPEEPPGRIPGR